jgi:hypothetical protein
MRGTSFRVLATLALIAGAVHGKLHYDKQRGQVVVMERRGPAPGEEATPRRAESRRRSADVSVPLVRAAELLDAGSFDEADDVLAQALATGPRAEQRTVALNLAGESALLRALSVIIPKHPFADGQSLYRVTLPAGQAVVGRVEGALDGEFIDLQLEDGRQLRPRRERLKGLEAFGAKKFVARQQRELRRRETKLGPRASALEIYRMLVGHCLEFGLQARAVEFLRRALALPAGGVLIDLFCEGELRAYRQTQARIAGITDLEMTVAVAGPEVEMGVRRAPRIESQEVAPVSASPGGDAKGAQAEPPTNATQKASPLLAAPQWHKADELYRRGLAIYRRSFRGTATQKSEAVTRSKVIFEKAQDALKAIEERFSNDQVFERRAVELQQLLYDCLKRQSI